MIRILLILFVKTMNSIISSLVMMYLLLFFLKLKMRHSKQSWKKLHHFKTEDF